MSPFADFYRGRRVLLTGHTGFQGAWLALWLRRLGAEVHGLALQPEPGPSLYSLVREGTFTSERMVDVRDFDPLRAAIAAVQPQLILHLARHGAGPGSREPLATFYTNAVGTAHLLEAVRQLHLGCDIVVATGDTCYQACEGVEAFRETDALGGRDVSSVSKAAMELVAGAWNASYFAGDASLGRVVTARAGEVIGGGDFSANRIVPECMLALAARRPIVIRDVVSERAWMHVLDALSGYLALAAHIGAQPGNAPTISPMNFGPLPGDYRTARDFVEALMRHWPGRWEPAAENHAGDACGVRMAIHKADAALGWLPTWPFEESVRQTAYWYREHASGETAKALHAVTLGQIEAFEQSALARGVAWARGA